MELVVVERQHHLIGADEEGCAVGTDSDGDSASKQRFVDRSQRTGMIAESTNPRSQLSTRARAAMRVRHAVPFRRVMIPRDAALIQRLGSPGVDGSVIPDAEAILAAVHVDPRSAAVAAELVLEESTDPVERVKARWALGFAHREMADLAAGRDPAARSDRGSARSRRYDAGRADRHESGARGDEPRDAGRRSSCSSRRSWCSRAPTGPGR